jgi:UDP-N-acetylglucosamine transferase subunit ALG13
MLTVTLGTIPYPFPRVIAWLQVLIENGLITEPTFIQSGVTDVSPLAGYSLIQTRPIVESSELIHMVNQSRLVISHAGQGSTRMLAAQGASFVLLPRLALHKEHIDDHQLLFARSMQPFGIRHCLTLDELSLAILNPPSPLEIQLFNGPQLSEYLREAYPKEARIHTYRRRKRRIR